MAKVLQVTQYQANDGSLFTSEHEADAHDFMLENKASIDAAAEAFLNTTKAIDRSRNMQANVITNFLAFYLPWKDAGSQPVERTEFDTPKEAKVVDGTAAAEAAGEVEQPAVAEGEQPAAGSELF